MNQTSLAPVPPVPARATHLPAGLRVEEALRIAEEISGTHAASTREVYRVTCGQWERWCLARRVVPMPAAPAMICVYLTDRAKEGVSIGTIDMACGAISYIYRRHGLEDPVLCEGVRQVRRGLRRLIGAAPRRQARPLQAEDIRTIVTAIDRATAKGARDAVIILLGFGSALRRSELAALEVGDIEFKPGGIIVTVTGSKSDQDGEGQRVAVAHGQHAASDPPRHSTRGSLCAAGRQVRCSPACKDGSQPGPDLEQAVAIALRNRATSASRLSSSATSAQPRRWSTPPAAISDCDANSPTRPSILLLVVVPDFSTGALEVA